MHVATNVVGGVAILLTLGFASAGDKPAREVAHEKERKKLQGAWKVVSLVIRGEEEADERVKAIRFVFKDGVVKSELLKDFAETGFMSVRLDVTTTPKIFDMVDWEKDFKDAEEVLEGVYLIDGDTLKLCFTLQGERPAKGNRPLVFESKEGSNNVLITLRREKR
jgi:uncharacterized protein (TIGR03067 family)